MYIIIGASTGDWQDDLKNHIQSLFLNLARNWSGYKNIREIDVQRFIVGSDLTEMILSESISYIDEAKKTLGNIDCSYILSFLDSELDSYLKIKNQLRKERKVVLRKIAYNLLNLKVSHMSS